MNKNILVIDIETSGFNHTKDVIFEIGIVSLDLESGNIKTLFDSVIREPHLSQRHRDSWIFSNSDLTPELVRDAPKVETVKDQIQEIIDSYPEGITAFNRNFDIDFLKNRGFKFLKLLPCPMLLSTDIIKLPSKNGYSDYKWPSAQEAWNFYYPETPYQEKHRGADDARIEAMIVYKMYTLGIFKI